MARKKKPKAKPMGTIWRVPDDLWEKIKVVLDELDPPAKTGRKRADERSCLDGVIYRMRSGVQWNQLPKDFGDDSSVHRAFQRWVEKGILERLWAMLAKECEELGEVDWRWQSVDGSMGKARFGGIKWARTRRIAAKTA